MTGSPRPSDPGGINRQAALQSLFNDLPKAAAPRREALQAIRTEFYAELARQARGPLNEFARDQPQSTQNERSDLATGINRTCRALGLAVTCPRSGLPATIVVDPKRHGDAVTLRYRFYTLDATGRRTATFTCSELPELDLCQAPTRVEALAKGYKAEGRRR